MTLGPTLTQKGTDPNTERDRPQHRKGPTPTQKGTDPNTERDRPQQITNLCLLLSLSLLN